MHSNPQQSTQKIRKRAKYVLKKHLERLKRLDVQPNIFQLNIGAPLKTWLAFA